MSRNIILNTLVEFFKLEFFLSGIKKYAHFGGRDGRKEFFLFQLSVILIFIGLKTFVEKFSGYAYLFGYVIFMFPPVASSMVRRLHDVGKSGFRLPGCILLGSLSFIFGMIVFNASDFLLGLIAVVSFILMFFPFILFFLPSSKRPNKYEAQKSHPVRHGLMLTSFILIFMFFLYLLGALVSQVNVLPQEESLTAEEIKQIDDLIKEYQLSK